MDQELQRIADRLARACSPEEIFGEVQAPLPEMLFLLKQQYRALARLTHPDMYATPQEKSVAQAAFQRLTDLFAEAREKAACGAYGRPATAEAVLRTSKREYRVDGRYSEDGIFNVYPCSYSQDGRIRRAALRIVRDPRDNDLAENEASILQVLAAGRGAERFSPYIPGLLDAFLYQEAGIRRQAVLLPRYDGWYSLADVRAAYPAGIDPKDMAWIWRRLLVGLGFAHGNRVIHGAILPPNVWIQPEEHGLMLVNWAYAVRNAATTGGRLGAVVAGYADWYPQEVWKKQIPVPGLDIQMAAVCMLWLLGGDPQKKRLPVSVPAPLGAFLRGCSLPGARAPQDAWALKDEFDELIGTLWGTRKFHPFSMTTNP